MPQKIKVLFLAADPFSDRAPLRLDEEMRAITQAIRQGRARDTVELVSCFGTRTRDLHRALLWHQPQIVHFAGHGGRSGVIYLGDEHGRPRAVDKDALSRLFGILDGGVRAVILNACDTLPVVEALRDVVDYVIGTNRLISDGSALTFSEGLYTALSFGKGMRQAFDFAVNQLELDGSPESETPVLRMRPGADAEPLPPVPAGAPAGGVGPGVVADIEQSPTLGNVSGGSVNIVGVDRAGPRGDKRTVIQRPTVETMTNVEFNLVGERTGAPPSHE
jgi:hypothetical protein